MREELESLLLVLAIGSSVAIGAKRAGVPFNIALVLGGLLLVFMDVLPRAPLDPDIVLVAFLPVLIFEGALFADVDHLRRALDNCGRQQRRGLLLVDRAREQPALPVIALEHLQ